MFNMCSCWKVSKTGSRGIEYKGQSDDNIARHPLRKDKIELLGKFSCICSGTLYTLGKIYTFIIRFILYPQINIDNIVHFTIINLKL